MCIPPVVFVQRLILAEAGDDCDAVAFALNDVQECPGCTIDTITGLTRVVVRVLNQYAGDWQRTMSEDLRDLLDMLDASERPG